MNWQKLKLRRQVKNFPHNSGEKITLSGSKTKIVSGVHIDFSPCRVTFKQEGNAEYQISYIRGEYDGTKMVCLLTIHI